MAKIKQIYAREILDSRGNPTVESTVLLEDGAYGVSSVPSGISVGKYEAIELRDRDPKRYGGFGVLTAVQNVNAIIGPKLVGQEAGEQHALDSLMLELDGTENKGKLGANAILSVSQAICKAAATSARLSLFTYINQIAGKYGLQAVVNHIPTPLFNILNGGN